MAFNVWKGRGVAPQPEGAYGLKLLTLLLPAASDVAAAAERLRAAGREASDRDGGTFTRDPSGHGILIRHS